MKKLKGRLLPGNSVRNKEWIEEVWENLEDLFDELEIQNYEHWDTKKPMIDLDFETKELKKEFPREGIIIAKSIGVALALKAIEEKKIKPKACIFLGTPVIFCESNSIPIEKWIRELEIPSLFIQNDEDPAIDADELKDYLYENKVKNFRLKDFDSESHDYFDMNSIRVEVEKFLEKI